MTSRSPGSGVDVTPSVGGVTLAWCEPRLSKGGRRVLFALAALFAVVLFLLVPLLSRFVGNPVLLWFLAMPTSLALPMLSALWAGGTVRRVLRISSAGVSVRGSTPLPLAATDDAVLLVDGPRGWSASTVSELERRARVDPESAEVLRMSCGVDLVLKGAVVPVARGISPAEALVIARLLRQHVGTGDQGLEDRLALDALEQMRDTRNVEVR